ncbi:X-Pro aminopeptidase [Azospirillum sp. TSH58]|uniref:aminopeptidase P family protein n=1 Tax=Azospirillum sp. TSH58 TaxID=664962 RepID=UPI000D60224D|nr:aminopeptidase P family protein [Azospirillum sp. TSH58]AWJ84582.1 X-Pro aminopeptidase [Azospirillum sp. TSH58]PWC73851.1 X-Pro aminopeptidase [Azospirillum sp. TSH58]
MSSAYRGDETLAQLLAQAGLPQTPADIRSLVAGVLAAPEGEDPDGWMVLVGARLPDDLATQLRALKADLADSRAADGHIAGAPDYAARIAALRGVLARADLDGFIVPRGDEHQGEYVPPRAQRLAWLTGFTGSAGHAIVGRQRAAIFVDGRYTLQVQAEVSGDLYEYRHLVDDPLTEWVAEALPRGGRLGYDPWLHTAGWVERTRQQLERIGLSLVPCPDNPVDRVWTDQPPPPLAPVVAQDLVFAGDSAADKRARIAGDLTRNGIGAVVLTQPDSIAWLLNLRGADVPCTPLPLSFAILKDDAQVDLFIDRRKLAPGVESHLGNQVAVRAPDELGAALDGLGREGRKVMADPASTSAWIFDRLHMAGAKLERNPDPCALPKACKNEAELAGTRAAHARDGAALVRFLHWLSQEAPSGTVTEIAAAERLLAFRRANDRFRGLSFDTISGAGPNGAIVHYRVSEATDRRLEPGSLFLLDSGAQYQDGTTDVTRTIAIGAPTPEMRERFTLVLKGHIAVSTARFPRGTTGSQLDTLARLPLWSLGLDYDHGTGHGVGSYLSVHEGPQRISKVPNSVALQPGMILSNEPGYYKTGAYGIRIENLIVVQPLDLPMAERPMLGFEVLTLAPIDRNLVEPALLTQAEIAWLNAYHTRVREALEPRLAGGADAAVTQWLRHATSPIIV